MIKLLKTERPKYVLKIYDIPISSPILETYYKYYDSDNTMVISDNRQELQDLLNNNFTTGIISPGSKIYFSPDSLVSPLYLSKLKNYNIDIKRVVKPENADIIVTSKFTILYDYLVLTSEYQNDRRFVFSLYSNTEAEKAKEQLEKVFGFPFYYGIKSSSARLAQKYNLTYQYPNKIIHDIDFIKYVFQFLPVIDDDTYVNVLDMLKHEDKSVRQVGANCLQYYNFGNHLFDLMDYYYNRQRFCVPDSQMSQSEKFISAALSISLDSHCYYRDYNSYKRILRLVMENPLNTQSTDNIAQQIINKYLDDIESDYSYQTIKDSLKLIGYTIKLEKLPDDQNGETESGN